MNNIAKNAYIIMLTILAVMTGYFLVVAFKSYTVSYNNEIAPKQKEIIEYIENLENETAQLESDILNMRTQIENFRNSSPQDNLLSAELQTEIDALNQKAGLKEASGSGISIILDDNTAGADLAQKTNPSTYNAENFIIHYTDLLYIVREIAPYAEAISINDIRLTDNFNIRCVGTVIMVNSTRLAPPYTINAIGDQTKLEDSLNNCSQYIYLKNNFMPVKYSLEENLTLPAAVSVFSTNGIETISD